jgi:hypothetical protein
MDGRGIVETAVIPERRRSVYRQDEDQHAEKNNGEKNPGPASHLQMDGYV